MRIRWGEAPRIIGGLGKLAITAAKSTMDKVSRPPIRAVLANAEDVSDKSRYGSGADRLFIVPTIRFRLLFVPVVLAHARRKHFRVAADLVDREHARLGPAIRFLLRWAAHRPSCDR